MIKRFIKKFKAEEDELKEIFSKKYFYSYKSILKEVIKVISKNEEVWGKEVFPDYTRIYEIVDGDYQGTLVFIIGAMGYQPNEYFITKIYYGSCSGCDTLQSIYEYSEENKPNKEQIKSYMSLALHLIQKMKEV